MSVYTHLTLSEREYREEKLKEGVSIRKIAAALERSPSTISREIRRNWSKKANRYHHWNANHRYKYRRKRCHRKNNLTKYPAVVTFVPKARLSCPTRSPPSGAADMQSIPMQQHG